MLSQQHLDHLFNTLDDADDELGRRSDPDINISKHNITTIFYSNDDDDDDDENKANRYGLPVE
jgi:hypothetical protein